MNKGNTAINGALKTAMGALHALDDAGIGVIEVKVSSGRPIIRVDQAPPFVRGVTKIFRKRETVLAAPYFGAQLEWSSFAPVPRLVAGGAA